MNLGISLTIRVQKTRTFLGVHTRRRKKLSDKYRREFVREKSRAGKSSSIFVTFFSFKGSFERRKSN